MKFLINNFVLEDTMSINNTNAKDRILKAVKDSTDSEMAAQITISVIHSFLAQIQSEKQARPDDLRERIQAIAV